MRKESAKLANRTEFESAREVKFASGSLGGYIKPPLMQSPTKKGLSQRSNSNSDAVFIQKKVGIKNNRNELPLKNGAKAMLSIKSNDIVFSQTMNLSSLLTTNAQ